MIDMISTESLPRKTSSLSEAERRKKVLYISSVKELAVTNKLRRNRAHDGCQYCGNQETSDKWVEKYFP